MPRPLEVAAKELEKGDVTTTMHDDPPECSREFMGTMLSSLVSFPLLLWVFSIVRRIVFQAAHDFECEALLKGKPITEAAAAMALVPALCMIYLLISIPMRNYAATIGLFLVWTACYAVLLDVPDLTSKSTFGIYETSSYLSSPLSPMSSLANNNTSAYFNNNINTCKCWTEKCEDMVYDKYFQVSYADDVGYTKLSAKDEGEGNGVVKDGSSLRASSNAQHHAICFSANSTYEGKKTMCYDCYGCENKYLKRVQKSRWRLGNKLYAMNILLVVANLIVFVAEVWARYMG